MAKKVERLQDTPEFMKKYNQTLKRMNERNQTAEQKKSRSKKSDNKLPDYAEINEENLIRQLFEEDLKRKIEKYKLDEGPESEYYEDTWEHRHHKRDGLWDVKADETIEYFDPELSYELTGYRPITMTEGMDFDPEPFREAARIYEETGHYTEYPQGCKPYADFWMEQLKRCAEGYTVGKYRITGDHYFFLNFYHMQTVKKDASKKTRGRIQSFPMFIAKQYEFFHYVELCEYIGRDVCMLKARGLGFSEILSCLGARPFITTRQFRTVYTADSDAHLDPLLSKCWVQLNWLNLNTDGGMKRSRQKIDNIKQKRASLLNKEGVEYGALSEVEGIVADDPGKIRGDRTERLIFEEAGSNKNLVKSWIQGNALVELGGEKVGTRIAGGTGGDSGPNLAGLAKMFNNPRSYNVLPYKNKYTRDGKTAFTGFFIPAHEFSLNPEFYDHRGVTDSVRFKEWYEEQRKKMEGQDLLDYCAEHCFTPDEALLRQGDNIFDSIVISDRLTQIRVFKEDYIKPEPTALLWGTEDRTWVKSQMSASSKLLVVEPPILDTDGNPYNNLYVAGIDSIDMGKDESAIDSDVSDFCIVIKKRIHGMEAPQYVAMYKDRPRKIRDAYEMAMKLLIWYNCKAMLEFTKISIQQYFDKYNKKHLFMQRPEFAVSNKLRNRPTTKQLIGLPATEAVITHGLELIEMYVEDYSKYIMFDEMLEELLNYSYEEKRKFDIVAAMSQCEIGDEALTGLPIRNAKQVSKEWKDYGYYIDETGHKRFGEIPDKNKNNYITPKWHF